MVRYRQSVVGAAWSLLQPLLLMAVFTVFLGLLIRVPSGELPYPVFFFLGLVPWQMVAKIVGEGSTSIVDQGSLVLHVYFPRVYLPLAVALAALVDLALASIALVVLMLVVGVPIQPTVVVAPVFVAIAWLTGIAAALWLGATNVKYRDITQLLPFLVQLWMFVSPVLYPSTLVPSEYLVLYYLNPIALAVDGFRWSVAGAALPPLIGWAASIGAMLCLLSFAYWSFKRREPMFADSL